ncbi:MAG: S8 family peptidase [Bacilli bacterium]
MAERPLILFGQPHKAEKSKRGGGAPIFQRPSHSRQAERLAPKMTALQNAVATLKQSPMGIEAEKTLVFDVVGGADNFYTAVKNLGSDAEWIFDMPEQFDVSDDFYVLKENKKTKERTRDEKKNTIGGKVYCMLSNVRAMEELLSLWGRYSQDPNTVFPNGKTGLRDVFDNLEGMHFWGYKERVEETGILEIWREELQDTTLSEVRCEFELFFRSDSQKRDRNEQQLRNEITTLAGTVISSSVIMDIAYHAVLATVPRRVAESIINGNRNVSIVTAEQIMFFRPVGQAVVIPQDNSFDGDFQIPSSDDIIDEPVIALFDGLPQENHPYLQGRITVDDPDGYATNYVVEARKHGTSMASMAALGDLSKIVHAATRKIYVRPLMKPIQWGADYFEQIPDDSLLVDKIHVAVPRLFEEEAGKVAPTVKVINLSIGLSYRQFDRSMSPCARLLDWLSWNYKVLFVVSAGNHPDNMDTGMKFTDFVAADLASRDKAVIDHVNNESRNLRLLSPAESVNALTVGATFEDASEFTENTRQILPCSDGLPSAINSVGMGMNNAIKPDILFPGGRNWVRESIRHGFNGTVIEWTDSPTREPGTASAAPFVAGSSASKVMYTFGTSNAAALISHEASRCYDVLLEVFGNADEAVPDEHLALLIKAMLVHGAEWGALADKYAKVLNLTKRKDSSSKLHRFLGFGKPNIERAIECAKNRVTLIGYGDLKNGEAHTYDLPLPFNFSRSKICRRLTATLTYFPPFVPTRQKYRAAQLWYSIENGKKNLLDSRMDVDWNAAVRGSVQHEIFENNNTVVWDEDDALQVKVNCRGDADDRFSGSVPYALMVSFEIKDAIDIDVYAKIAERVSTKVPI